MRFLAKERASQETKRESRNFSYILEGFVMNSVELDVIMTISQPCLYFLTYCKFTVSVFNSLEYV